MTGVQTCALPISVKRANKESAADVTVFITGIGQPMDIHGYNLSEKTIPGERATFVIRRHSLISFVIDVGFCCDERYYNLELEKSQILWTGLSATV